MTRAVAVALSAAALAAALSGCGTVGNLWSCCSSGDHSVYGGVILDARFMRDNALNAAHPEDWVGLGNAVAGICFCALDLPFSAVADTLTLPITIRATLEKEASTRPPIEPSHESPGLQQP